MNGPLGKPLLHGARARELYRSTRLRAVVNELTDLFETPAHSDDDDVLVEVVLHFLAQVRRYLDGEAQVHDKRPRVVQSHRPAAAPGRALLDTHPKVQLALEGIATRCTQARLRLSDISDAVELSPSHLDRLLKRDTGLGFVDHVRRARVALAEQRLVMSDEPVKAIALSVGFLHVSSFDRSFARVHGCSPTSWRELQRALPKRASGT